MSGRLVLYDGVVGFCTDISRESASGAWTVLVKVNLTRAESNELFLSGDSMLSWPVDGLLPASSDSPMPERSGMFISEIAAHADGLRIRYRERSQAEHTAAVLQMQLVQLGIGEET